MDIDLLPDPRDYEIYFAQSLSKSSAKDVEEISQISGAFDRIAVSVELNNFDPTEFIPLYPQWYHILTRFSLLFYGLGSKIELMHHFATNFLNKFGFVVEIDGFSDQPRLLQSALNSLCDFAQIGSHSFNDLEEFLRTNNTTATLIIHSLDSSILSEVSDPKSFLPDAANSEYFHIIATIDRVPLLSLSLMSDLRFYPIQVKTERPYVQEIGFSKSQKTAASNDSIERYVGVLKTLTNVANGIFKVLLKHQIKTGEGLTQNEWCEKATSELCVKLHTAFKMQINEFLDHRLITDKKGSEFFTIPLNNVQLQNLLSKLEEESS
ncbi:origin recognition complex subunit 2 isoform X1 [Histomonas meleagridis]|uniref:origin recognition complex subunit 2 isoform X1 n=1 Tax=Histomonas meleagridis TaxID=135588 RepID=UPI00355ACD7C|nr:origin recognition complex subunit 2 isoform X1 [Histomonas meleagridis]KAH0804066.1 origin recognition complex subunit 2 isoform X1 [Histomonas meleagridis]